MWNKAAIRRETDAGWCSMLRGLKKKKIGLEDVHVCLMVTRDRGNPAAFLGPEFLRGITKLRTPPGAVASFFEGRVQGSRLRGSFGVDVSSMKGEQRRHAKSGGGSIMIDIDVYMYIQTYSANSMRSRRPRSHRPRSAAALLSGAADSKSAA